MISRIHEHINRQKYNKITLTMNLNLSENVSAIKLKKIVNDYVQNKVA